VLYQKDAGVVEARDKVPTLKERTRGQGLRMEVLWGGKKKKGGAG